MERHFTNSVYVYNPKTKEFLFVQLHLFLNHAQHLGNEPGQLHVLHFHLARPPETQDRMGDACASVDLHLDLPDSARHLLHIGQKSGVAPGPFPEILQKHFHIGLLAFHDLKRVVYFMGEPRSHFPQFGQTAGPVQLFAQLLALALALAQHFFHISGQIKGRQKNDDATAQHGQDKKKHRGTRSPEKNGRILAHGHNPARMLQNAAGVGGPGAIIQNIEDRKSVVWERV